MFFLYYFTFCDILIQNVKTYTEEERMSGTILLIVLGFALLISGADVLVRGSSNLAKRFHIPEMIIGLTIVALGTSMPELMITITSAGKGATDLIIGNAIGSNLCNLLLILGITAILRPIKLEDEVKIVHLPVAYVSTLAILAMGLGLFGSERGVINKEDGRILIILYFIYFFYPIFIEITDVLKNGRKNKEGSDGHKISVILSLLYIVVGVVLLKFGGDLVVEEASELALIFGLSERVIGLTIVAIGTALPELITAVIAVAKEEGGLAIGNLVGSCILNSFLILGTGALITPLSFSSGFNENLMLLAGAILFIWISCFVGKKNTITRYKAGVLLAMFVFYMWRLFV